MKNPTNVTIYCFYEGGRYSDFKSEDCQTRKEAFRKANDPNWWPNDFNCTKDTACIQIKNIATGIIEAKIFINQ